MFVHALLTRTRLLALKSSDAVVLIGGMAGWYGRPFCGREGCCWSNVEGLYAMDLLGFIAGGWLYGLLLIRLEM